MDKAQSEVPLQQRSQPPHAEPQAQHGDSDTAPPQTTMPEMNLHQHLIAAQAASMATYSYGPYAAPSYARDPHAATGSPDEHGQQYGPTMASSAYGPAMSNHRNGLDDKRKDLMSSKRAAQNRAAQRAFRQRKEGYIKKLEDQVRNFSALEQSYEQVKEENLKLHDYILTLQSRLLDVCGRFPPPSQPLNPPPRSSGLPVLSTATEKLKDAGAAAGADAHTAASAIENLKQTAAAADAEVSTAALESENANTRQISTEAVQSEPTNISSDPAQAEQTNSSNKNQALGW